jgi:hypothetical protein
MAINKNAFATVGAQKQLARMAPAARSAGSNEGAAEPILIWDQPIVSARYFRPKGAG